jgi:hypothetical protein
MLGPLGAVQVIHPDDKEKDREVFSKVRQCAELPAASLRVRLRR